MRPEGELTDSGTDLLRDVLSIMASGESLEAVLHGVAQAVVDHLDAAFARVWLIERSSQDLVLVQVKTRDWPGELERRALAEFPAPPNARKILHRWRDRKRLPDVQEL